MRVLFVCTGNTCRSQMAEGLLRKIKPEWEILSAGTKAETKVNPFAVEVMKEKGIDISCQQPKNVSLFTNQDFDYVITLCSSAEQSCPSFTGNIKHRLHLPFDDPAEATGSKEEILAVYRKVRDQIELSLEKYFGVQKPF